MQNLKIRHKIRHYFFPHLVQKVVLVTIKYLRKKVQLLVIQMSEIYCFICKQHIENVNQNASNTTNDKAMILLMLIIMFVIVKK